MARGHFGEEDAQRKRDLALAKSEGGQRFMERASNHPNVGAGGIRNSAVYMELRDVPLDKMLRILDVLDSPETAEQRELREAREAVIEAALMRDATIDEALWHGADGVLDAAVARLRAAEAAAKAGGR